MLVKDQITFRMNELGINAPELGRRLGVSAQTVRFWCEGRSFPGKAKTPLLESQLSFKIDFSEGATKATNTVEASLRETDIATLLTISKLPPQHRILLSKVAEAMLGAIEAAGVSESAVETVRVAKRTARKPSDDHGFPAKR